MKLDKILGQKIELSDLLGDPQKYQGHKSFKVVHLCFQDFGGAGKAAHRLHKGLLAIGVDSTMLVLNKGSRDPSVKVLPNDYSTGMTNCLDVPVYNSPVWNKQEDRWRKLVSGYPERLTWIERFTDSVSDVRLERVQEIQDADIINLHWVAGAVDWPRAPLAICPCQAVLQVNF